MTLSEVLSLLNQKGKQESETTQDFYTRITRGLNGLTDQQWQSLPEEVQIWTNNAVNAMNDHRAIAAPPWGAEPETNTAPTAQPAQPAPTPAAQTTRPVTRPTGPAPATTTTTATATPSVEKEKKPRGQGTMAVRKLLLAKPGIKPDDAVNEVNAMGVGAVSKATVDMAVYELKIWLKLLAEANMLTDQAKKHPLAVAG